VANTYDVTPAAVASELPGLYPGGFSATSTPTDAKVQELIDEADTVVTLRITDDVGASPALSDKAAKVAKRFIINYVKAQVILLLYVGKDPAYVASIAQPYIDSATRLLEYIDKLGSQAIGTGESSAATMGHMTSRPLILESWDLDGQRGCSVYPYGDRGRF
jgi:hypothetical protein